MPGLGKSGTSRMRFFSSSQFCGALIGNLEVSFNAKRASIQQLSTGFAHLVDTRRARTLLQLLAQGPMLFGCAGGHHFYVAIAAVAHPSGDAGLRSLALHEPAEAHTLYAARNDVMAGL